MKSGVIWGGAVVNFGTQRRHHGPCDGWHMQRAGQFHSGRFGDTMRWVREVHRGQEQARRTKEATYPELAGGEGRARLVVLAAVTGGRWSAESAQFLRCLAQAKVETAPVLMQNRVKAAWLRR